MGSFVKGSGTLGLGTWPLGVDAVRFRVEGFGAYRTFKCYMLNYTCVHKPYKMVGYDPLIRGSNLQNH